jgi:CheY-like chemotaxis protein/HPt (histidine-containing phosphotransfer) domain-containing protein
VLTKPIREQSLLDGFARLFGKSGQSATFVEHEPVLIPQIPCQPLRVLLAEDHKINQRLAVMLLHQASHDVDVAENGEQAVAAVLNSDYDIVLMDVQMPVLDGVEATKRIRALPPPKGIIPIVALTAHAMAGARDEYLAAGMDDYLSKPLEPAALFAALARLANPSATASSSQKTPPADTELHGAEKEADVDELLESGIAILDPVRVATLERVLPTVELIEFVRMFLESLGGLASRIHPLLTGLEFEELCREAHALAGTAGNVGALQVSHWARELEHACKKRDTAAMDRASKAVGQALPQTKVELLRWLDEHRIAAE